MRKVLTRLEKLEAEYPGILLTAKACLDAGKSADSTAHTIAERHPGADVSRSTIDKFRSKRWLTQKSSLQEQKDKYTAVASVISETGLDAAAAAILFERVPDLTSTQLIALRRVKIQKDKIKLEKQKARNAGKTAQQLLGENQATADPEAGLKAANAMRAIFGIEPIQP